jgi:hypothetical protein
MRLDEAIGDGEAEAGGTFGALRHRSDIDRYRAAGARSASIEDDAARPRQEPATAVK